MSKPLDKLEPKIFPSVQKHFSPHPPTLLHLCFWDLPVDLEKCLILHSIYTLYLWKCYMKNINPSPNRAHFNTLPYGFSHSSCVQLLWNMACPSFQQESLKKSSEASCWSQTTTHREKRQLKHETSLMKSPCRGLTLESEKKEGAVSAACNLFSQFILWERQVLQGWFSWLWISWRFLRTRFRAVLICKCTSASRSLFEDITKSNHGIAARFSVPRS